jgi:hypothetical protein
MCAVSSSASHEAIGEATATQINDSPRRKLNAHHGELPLNDVDRKDNHPRTYTQAVKTKASVNGSGNCHTPEFPWMV